MSALRTTTTCTDCGKTIPPALPDDALCVRCRYPTKKAAEHLDGDGNPVPTEYDIAADAHAFNQQNQDGSGIDSDSAAKVDHIDIDQFEAWFDWLDRGDDHAVLLRVKLIRHICGKSNCGTDAEFAAKYGLSKGRISQLRKEIKSELGRLGNCNNRRR